MIHEALRLPAVHAMAQITAHTPEAVQGRVSLVSHAWIGPSVGNETVERPS